jgi:hypothetical protein
MKLAAISKSTVFTLALIAASSAFASTKGSLQIDNPVTVNGTTLKPGDYKVEWEGSGPNVEISILQGKKVMAKAPAHLVQLAKPAAYNATVTRPGSGSASSLAGVRFGGKATAIDLGDSGQGMQGGSSK